MKRIARHLAAAGLLLLAAAPARGRDPDSFWSVGAGVGVGELAPMLSVLQGTGAPRVWGLDVGSDPYGAWYADTGDALYAEPPLPDSSLAAPSGTTERTFLVGPRVRWYFRPLEEISGFVDLRAAATYNSVEVESEDFHRERRRWGGELGSGVGFEWFPRDGRVTLAAQTDVFSIRLERDERRFDDPGGSTILTDDVLSFIVQFQPRFYLRLYF